MASGNASWQLIRISNRGVEHSIPTAWIGDREGFERFQRERYKQLDSVTALLEEELTPATRTMMTLRQAMKAVIDDPTIESVADFDVAVAYKPTGFEYLGSTFIYVSRDILVKSGENLIAKMAQPVEEGGHAVSVVEPVEPSTPALGLNFPRARLGMLYLPLKFDDAQVISEVSPNDFAKVVLKRFGVAMKDPMLRYK